MPSNRVLAAATTSALMVAGLLAGAAGPAAAHDRHHPPGHHGHHDHAKLAPRTHFTMAPDGSSGRTQGGEGIPNIDSVKSTIRTYYNATNGIADKNDSPYIREMRRITARQLSSLRRAYRHAVRHHRKPALVFDADDTTLMTYDMEDAAMKFTFDPALQDVWVQDQRFPATPSMVGFVNAAQRMGFTIFGLTGRNDDQKAATVANLAKVGYSPDAFPTSRFFTKWTGVGASQQPSYISCAAAKCTTVEFKAGVRKHIEQDLGYDIVLNVGDQWSDLQGGFADRTLKLPNPTYYLPSPNLPGVNQPWLAPRSHFTMRPDGSSGRTQGGEGIPNIDSVKSTIRVYDNATAGISDKTTSPYISEMARLTRRITPRYVRECRVANARGQRPALVFDADDTTLWTYDMEDAAMKFTFDPALQDVWVQDQRFPATPSMVGFVNTVHAAGCTIIGLTGRNDNQKAATIANLGKVGYVGFTADNYYTKWTGAGASQQPSYVRCASAKCTTIEYKSQTRKHIAAQGYRILGNFGDQYSDLIGGYGRPVKLPNPTYYLP